MEEKHTSKSGFPTLRYANLLLIIFLTGILFTIVTSCSTKKNGFTRRAYHNLTSHYNAYWNGNESFKEGVREIEKNAKDNYTLVLPVYKYGNQQDAQAAYPNMDRAIEKASKVIQRHSMYFDRKEWVKWIDDSYMLIGKSYLYKKEYSSARRTFDFVTNRFSKENSRFEAELWLARTYQQNKEFAKSETVLDNFNSSLRSGKAPDYLEKEFVKVYANHFILQQKYEPAVKYLQRAIELNSKKKVRNRLMFILAQIYYELGETKEAAKLYQAVIRKNPPFEMAFNAKINLAKTYDSKSSNRSLIVKKLNKMLKDAKNEEFRDQIYYALAEIFLKDKNTEKGVEYLTLSVATSVDNDYQKAVSALKLADIHFEKPDYLLAQAYYDTAMQVLPAEFPNYDAIKQKTETLTGLITNLTAIQEQDSLQMMAALPEDKRNGIIDEIIKKIVEEEVKQKLEEQERQRTLSMLEQTSRQENRNIQQSGGWYFYNPSSVSFGFTEFSKKWGRRKLEDLWRLSNKQIITDFGEEGEETAQADSTKSDSTAALVSDPKKREYYLQNLPMTEEKMKESNLAIEEAYFNVGYIYKDGLKDNLKSIESFEKLLERYPMTNHRLMVYYQLYKNWEEVPDKDKALYYQNMIVKDYPESDYAKIIVDPNYNLVLEAQKSAAKNLYEDTYRAYMSNQFYLVINNYNEAASKYQDSKLFSKFEFLKALAIGKIQNLDSLAISLNKLVQTYPESEVKPLAEDILSRLKKDDSGNTIIEDATQVEASGGEKKADPGEIAATSMFTVNGASVHFFVFLVDAAKININALKIRLSDFNSKYFRSEQLKINSIIFKDEWQMITVGNFQDSGKSLNYLDAVTQNEYILSQIDGTDTKSMIISVDNYPILYREKNVNDYMNFFENIYLNPE